MQEGVQKNSTSLLLLFTLRARRRFPAARAGRKCSDRRVLFECILKMAEDQKAHLSA